MGSHRAPKVGASHQGCGAGSHQAGLLAGARGSEQRIDVVRLLSWGRTLPGEDAAGEGTISGSRAGPGGVVAMGDDGVGRGDRHVEAEPAGLGGLGVRGQQRGPQARAGPPGGEISRGRQRCEWGSGAV